MKGMLMMQLMRKIGLFQNDDGSAILVWPASWTKDGVQRKYLPAEAVEVILQHYLQEEKASR